MDSGETITPTLVGGRRTLDPLNTLPEFKLGSNEETEDADFRIVDQLGEGGMGVVSLAEQKAMRRLVAVKEPKGGDESHGRVLDEALIMGRMEHPNVVPAYSLGRRKNGRPMLVMKRVEGIPWEDVLLGTADPPEGHEADLAWHLRVLLQVCNALRFAHARRVVHRDIKPENVMVGEFGEVYLLDWGIALSLDPDADEGIPTSKSSKGLAGTPAFMAPEMTADDASGIDERTDVYLLGANLYMIVTGEPPHDGETLFHVCMAAFKSEPVEFDDETPSDLVEIVHRAMAREKEDRYPSVAAFADAVQDFLEHRASYALSDASHEMLEEVREGDDDADLSTRLLEAEFGFRQALTIWEGNEAANRGLQEAIEERVRSCIAREEVGGARTALEQLPAPNAELEAALIELEKKLENDALRVGYLEEFEQEQGLKTGTRSRQRTAIILGLAFAYLSFSAAWTNAPGKPIEPPSEWLDSYWRLLAIALVCIGIFWKKLMATAANRRLIGFLLAGIAGMFFVRWAATIVDVTAQYAQIVEMTVIGMTAFAIGAASSRFLGAAAALAYGSAITVTIATGGAVWVGLTALGTAHLVFCGSLARAWRPAATRSVSD